MSRAVAAALLALSATGLACDGGHKPAPAPVPPAITVAAAADLARALPVVGKAFERRGLGRVTFSFGASGLLAKQLQEGAPFDVFAAANVAFIDDAIRAGNCAADTKVVYAQGHLALFRHGPAADAAHAPSLADLNSGSVRKIAIANPEHAPYGRFAKQLLVHAGLWDALSSKVVYAENVQQALQFAESGNADAALVALSLALGSEQGSYVELDTSELAPLDQALAVCNGQGDPATARAFAKFVNGDEGRTILRQHGFLLPGESVLAQTQ